MDLRIYVKTLHIGGDMNRTFRIKSPSIILDLGGGKVTPLPASSLKGLLRQLACIVSHKTGLREAYYELFGADIRPTGLTESGSFRRCYNDNNELSEKPGSLVLVNKGVEREKVNSVIAPGIMIDLERGTAKRNRLWFYQYITLEQNSWVEYELWVRDELSEDGKRLLCLSLNMLKNSLIGGRITVGHGVILDVQFDDEICSGVL